MSGKAGVFEATRGLCRTAGRVHFAVRRMPAAGPRDLPEPCAALLEARLTLRAMGTVVTLVGRRPLWSGRAPGGLARAPDPGAAVRARRVLMREARWWVEAERRLSRFNPQSELCQLNRQAGRWCVVSPLLFQTLQAAAWAYRQTRGRFDPAVLDALERWGYDRDYALLARPCDSGNSLAPDPGPAREVACRASSRQPPFELDPVILAVRLRSGVRLDLGGIAKGVAADLSASRLQDAFEAVLVDAGGDIAAVAAPGMPPWRIALAVRGPGVPRAVWVRRGGVATSSTARRWNGPLGPAHHLIDPSTLCPANRGVRAVTAVASSAAGAEVLAKALAIAGPEGASELVASWPAKAAAFVQLDDGRVEVYRCRSG